MKIVTQSSPQGGIKEFIIKWTPRAAAVAIGGYYGLGIAYEWGLMASIDQFAIQVIKHFAGYAGVGALMPTAQWYAALGVRVTIGIVAGVIYDLTERAALCIGRRCHQLCCSKATL